LPESDLALLIGAAQIAGDIARRHFGAAPRTWDKGDGAGPVTVADLEVDEALRMHLCGARPGYGWLSEETPDTPARLSRRNTFIIDPIDGTRAFIDGARDWSHSLAIARDGIVTAAVVYVPLRDALYAAAEDTPATCNGAPIAVTTRTDLDGADVLSNRPALDPGHWRGGPPPVKRHFRSSLAYRLCLVAQGRFDAMLTLRGAWEWDIAAGALIVAAAGGTVTDRRGQPPAFNTPGRQADGLVAAGGLHGPLLARLA